MINKKITAPLLAIYSIVVFSGCAGAPDAVTPTTSSPNVSDSQVLEKLTQIAKDLENVKTKVNSLGPVNSSAAPTSSAKPIKSPAVENVVKGTPSATPAKTVTASSLPTPAATPTAEDNKVKYRKVLDNIVNTINSANYIQADVDKFERHLEDGKSSTNKLTMYAKKGGLVKIESTDSSIPANIGVKLSYISGDTGKVKIRPSGALSFVTTNLDKDDTRLTSYNGYILDSIDVFGMAKRFADPSYVAELTGKTKIGNDDVYILKITNKNANTLDPRIKYEYLGFEAKTYAIRLWQAFDDPQKDAFFDMTLNTFKILDTMPDSNFNV